jgi:hypothetical protein
MHIKISVLSVGWADWMATHIVTWRQLIFSLQLQYYSSLDLQICTPVIFLFREGSQLVAPPSHELFFRFHYIFFRFCQIFLRFYYFFYCD